MRGECSYEHSSQTKVRERYENASIVITSNRKHGGVTSSKVESPRTVELLAAYYNPVLGNGVK